MLFPINEYCKRTGADLFIVYIPTVNELNSRMGSPYSEATKKICSILKVPFLNLIPAFKKGLTDSIGTPYYFRHDEHWTKEGHQLAADEIKKFIDSYLLVHK